MQIFHFLRPKRFLLLFAPLLCLTTCLEPTRPEFQIEEAFYLVEGQILAGETGSKLRIRESDFREINLEFTPITSAMVVSVEASGERVGWTLTDPTEGVYAPPATFLAEPGQSWHFEIDLPDGTAIRSDEELIPPPVALDDVRVQFEQNSIFEEGLNRFIPRFEIFLDYTDPADRENFYAYDYNYWESVIICASCFNGRYLNGECVSFPPVFRYDYLCDTPECFSINPGGQISYGTDELTNGVSVTDFPVGGIPFQAYGGLLVEGVLLSITEEAHAYGKVIEDLTEGNSGLNPTIPAALDGNVRNLDPNGRTILGYLGAASASRVRTYLERSPETGTPLPFDNILRLEPIPPPGVPPRAPCEAPGRTSIKPEGWP